MKATILYLAIFVSLNALAQQVEKQWETKAELAVPESVLFADSVLYVSNVNGMPTEKNGLGFISKVALDGKILELKWAKSLDAPKGMGTYNGKLYVSNINSVAIFDLASGNKLSEIAIADSKFLNDVSISVNGIVAVSDMLTQTIHFIENDKLKQSIADDKLQRVNGLFWDDDILLAGTDGIVYKIDLEKENFEKYIENTGGIDGLEKVANNKFIITDWKGKMQFICPNKEPIELLNTTQIGINAADIGYDTKSKIIYVPTFKHNTVAAYKLSE